MVRGTYGTDAGADGVPAPRGAGYGDDRGAGYGRGYGIYGSPRDNDGDSPAPAPGAGLTCTTVADALNRQSSTSALVSATTVRSLPARFKGRTALGRNGHYF